MAGEMPKTPSLSDKKRHAKKNEIEKIEYKRSDVREQAEIEKGFFEHNKHLFSSKQAQDGFQSSVHSLFPN